MSPASNRKCAQPVEQASALEIQITSLFARSERRFIEVADARGNKARIVVYNVHKPNGVIQAFDNMLIPRSKYFIDGIR